MIYISICVKIYINTFNIIFAYKTRRTHMSKNINDLDWSASSIKFGSDNFSIQVISEFKDVLEKCREISLSEINSVNELRKISSEFDKLERCYSKLSIEDKKNIASGLLSVCSKLLQDYKEIKKNLENAEKLIVQIKKEILDSVTNLNKSNLGKITPELLLNFSNKELEDLKHNIKSEIDKYNSCKELVKTNKHLSKNTEFNKIVSDYRSEFSAYLYCLEKGFSGNGIMCIDDGIYIGEINNTKPHGLGLMMYAEDKYYQGQWKNGQRHGKGKLVDKTPIEGDWKYNEYDENGDNSKRFTYEQEIEKIEENYEYYIYKNKLEFVDRLNFFIKFFTDKEGSDSKNVKKVNSLLDEATNAISKSRKKRTLSLLVSIFFLIASVGVGVACIFYRHYVAVVIPLILVLCPYFE